jgi:hypothetical protein
MPMIVERDLQVGDEDTLNSNPRSSVDSSTKITSLGLKLINHVHVSVP